MNDAVVLIVDDSPTVRKIVQITLEREGYRVVQAADGLSALAAVTDYQPDLILLDIMLPLMDGYSICKIIRNKPDFRETPIIMLSGRDGLIDKMRGRMAGSSEYLTKPFDSNELLVTVHRHLDHLPRRSRAQPDMNTRYRRPF
jgi:twitching motility two-component system response regulator PilG